MELSGKIAVVTGASGGLGGEIACGLARAGMRCVCHYYRNREGAEAVLGRIRACGGEGWLVGGDLRTERGCVEVFKEVERHGRARVLVNSAAVFEKRGLGDVSFESVKGVFELNVVAGLVMSRYFAERLAGAAVEGEVAGKIVNMADVGAERPWAGYAEYCSSKAAVVGATKALAKELGPAICVNAVAPGMVQWPAGFDEGKKRRYLKRVPMGRIGGTGEVVDGILFVLRNDHFMGQVLVIDGGRSI